MADDKRLFLTIAHDLASFNDVLSKMAEIGKDELSLDELFILLEFGTRNLDITYRKRGLYTPNYMHNKHLTWFTGQY